MRLRLAHALLGAWIALGIVSAVVATTNFRTVDTVLGPGYRAELDQRIAPGGAAEERPVLRYLASELNRRLFRWRGYAEVALGALLLALLLGEPGVSAAARVALGATTAIAAGLAFGLTPALLRLGPPLDFLERPVPPAWQEAYGQFMRIHGWYMALDLVKLLLLVAALVALARTREGPRWGDMGPGGRSPAD